MISKKNKLKKSEWVKGQSKFAVKKVGNINTTIEVDGKKEKEQKKLKRRHEVWQEFQELVKKRASLLDNELLKIFHDSFRLPCKNCNKKQRRHGSAYCGEC